MTATERLEELLNQKDHEIAKLQAKLEKIEAEKERDWWEWVYPEELPKEQVLPVPRLEMTAETLDEDGYNVHFRYCLVYRHFLGHCVTVCLGYTRRGGGTRSRLASAQALVEDLPFRDGAHIMFDSRTFGFPAYAIVGDDVALIPPRREKD